MAAGIRVCADTDIGDIRHYSVSRGHDDPSSAVRNESGHTSHDLRIAPHLSVDILNENVKLLLDPADTETGDAGPLGLDLWR